MNSTSNTIDNSINPNTITISNGTNNVNSTGTINTSNSYTSAISTCTNSTCTNSTTGSIPTSGTSNPCNTSVTSTATQCYLPLQLRCRCSYTPCRWGPHLPCRCNHYHGDPTPTSRCTPTLGVGAATLHQVHDPV